MSTAGSYWLIALCVGLSGIGIAALHPEAAPQLGHITDLYGLSSAPFGLAFLPLIAVGGACTLPRMEAEAVQSLAEG